MSLVPASVNPAVVTSHPSKLFVHPSRMNLVPASVNPAVVTVSAPPHSLPHSPPPLPTVHYPPSQTSRSVSRFISNNTFKGRRRKNKMKVIRKAVLRVTAPSAY